MGHSLHMKTIVRVIMSINRDIDRGCIFYGSAASLAQGLRASVTHASFSSSNFSLIVCVKVGLSRRVTAFVPQAKAS